MTPTATAITVVKLVGFIARTIQTLQNESGTVHLGSATSFHSRGVAE